MEQTSIIDESTIVDNQDTSVDAIEKVNQYDKNTEYDISTDLYKNDQKIQNQNNEDNKENEDNEENKDNEENGDNEDNGDYDEKYDDTHIVDPCSTHINTTYDDGKNVDVDDDTSTTDTNTTSSSESFEESYGYGDEESNYSEESDNQYTTILDRLIKLRDDNLSDPHNSKYAAMFRYCDMDIDGVKKTITSHHTWAEYVNQALGFAKFILHNNREYGNVAIHSFNCPEWLIAAFGSMFAKKYFCGIYNTNNAEQCMHVIMTGNCNVLVVESYALLVDKYTSVVNDLKENNIKVVVIDNDKNVCDKMYNNKLNVFADVDIVDWISLNLESYVKDEDFENIVNTINPDDVCTLIFTSGTIKNPKAVEITHSNICAAVEGVMDRVKIYNFSERFVSYLPLSHIAGQTMDMYAPIYCKSPVHFAKPDALRGSLQQTLLTVRPTLFFGVPRVWEKFREALTKVSEKTYSDGWKGQAMSKFMSVVKFVERNYNTSENPLWLATLYPFSAISCRVANEIKKKLGLDQCRHFATGAAPISKDVLEYFSSIGICIRELYGMSETCGVISLSDHVHSVRGSCGRAIKGTKIKIGKYDEILVKGPTVYKCYHNSSDPNDIDEEGYFHTGDCGIIDTEGYLTITGRIKELIITAGGENIPPVRIEDLIKSNLPNDAQVMLVGDKKKFLTLLVFVPTTTSTTTSTTTTTSASNSMMPSVNDELNKTVNASIAAYNTQHAISNSQKVQMFKIVNESLTIENGMLTPTMKMKRSKIVERYNDIIESMYSIDQ